MDPYPLDRGELLRRRREIDALVRHRLGQPAGICSLDLRPDAGSAHAMMQRHEGEFLAGRFRVACAQIALIRRRLVHQLGLSLADEPMGRWALFRASQADYCRLALDPGFIDEADAPGWDVWTATGDALGRAPVLACWIPEPIVDRIEQATKLSPCAALEWD